MGSSLSRQEELFLHRQWAELLQEAMDADLETIAAATTTTDANDGSTTTTTTLAKKKTKKKGFQLSFQEWQAFLSALEQEDASSAASDVAARLTAPQLHVPAVALMVHVCAWWRGAIAATVLADRVEQLVHLVSSSQHSPDRTSDALPLQPTSTGETATAAENAAPASRRARLARFVQKKVVDRARLRGTHKAASSDDDDASEGTPLLLDTFEDLTYLVHTLLVQELPGALSTTNSSSSVDANVASTPPSSQVKEIVELYDDEIQNPDAFKQHPVLAVVMVVVLAIFAAKVEAQPHLAVRSVAHLEVLETSLSKSRSATTTSDKSDSSPPPSAKAPARWRLLVELEVALVHRQHEADVLQCLSNDGSALVETLRQMNANRVAAPHRSINGIETTATDATAGSAPPTQGERWAAGASQYIGQRPIWAQLRSHFLSAGVFEADKPTVLVFFGPSGYGKSELAKRVASVLHNIPMSELESSGKMVYIHMPSFCTKDSIYSLVDPPAAHVGSGILLSALQKHPDAVVVLDEFEKSTAESINNLWLSAFQRNGALRSLKEASRSVSTVRTTFILTCNIRADAIAAREDLYLASSPTEQEKIRSLFVTQCKEVCRQTMGDPFVNRVDSFLPFMPYTRAERRQFVCLLLERLLASQAVKGRRLAVTPSFVQAMVEQLHTFHAATLEEAVRAQVMFMVEAGWTEAVLTVERRVGGGSVVVLLPASATASASTSAGAPASQSCKSTPDVVEDGVGGARSLLVEPWAALPGGALVLQRWAAVFGADESTAPSPSPAPSPYPAAEVKDAPYHMVKAPLAEVEREVRSSNAATTPSLGLSAGAASSPLLPPPPQKQPTSPVLETQLDYEVALDKDKIVALERELEKTRAVVVQRDMEIVTLKEKVLLLQKALAVVVLALMSCLCLLALVVGLKLTLLFALVTIGAVVFVLGVPLALLLEAVRALFRILGPFKGGVLLLIMAAWIAKASRSIVSCPE